MFSKWTLSSPELREYFSFRRGNPRNSLRSPGFKHCLYRKVEENVNVPMISHQCLSTDTTAYLCLSTDDITTSRDFGKQDPRGARSGGEYGVAK